uniref:Fibronectin type-III domain-containing protein n=2 Tax=Neogobius melanostomus TaxID=47308 RepID=A0A8C6UV05_9GOBI
MTQVPSLKILCIFSPVCTVNAYRNKNKTFFITDIVDTMTRLLTVMVLFSQVFATRVTADKPGAPQCEPQNMLLSNVSRELLVTWEVHASCASLRDQLIYELVVLVEDKPVHQEEFAVMADHIGSSHSWSWMSFLPLECASHSVQIRSRYTNQTGPWTTGTLPGLEPSAEIQVYPQDHVFEVGSRATFCCIVPLGKTFSTMFLSNYRDAPSNMSMVNNHTYALTVDLLWPTLVSDADVKCKAQMDEGGSCAIVGYPPSDTDLQCETRDFQSVQCFWTVGPQIFSDPTTYWLLEKSCNGQPKGKCSQKVKVNNGERNWTLIARNVLGSIELVDEADLTKRVYMYAPAHMTVSAVSARNVTIAWTWTVQQYNLLNLTCQINLYDGTTNIQIEMCDIGLQSVVLNGLIPNWSYSAKVQCATETDFWKWSEWSKSISFHTKGDIPDALDVWMHNVNHQTLIIWKLLEDHQSHGHIIDYEVTWTDLAKAEQENKICVVHPTHSIALNLSTFQKYIVKVTARNTYGSSDPSQIFISSQSQDPEMITSRINGTGGGFSLSWAANVTASCGYIVDWYPVSGNSSEWLKVPPSNTSATIYSKNFKDGVRYILSVYICTEEAPVLLEKREGYVKEQRIPDNMFNNLRWQQHASDVTISWDQISLKEQSAHIYGYVLYCIDESTVLRVTTDDPEATSLTAAKLKMYSYTFTVHALTSEGECGLTTINANLSIQTDDLVSAIIISLVTAFTLVLLITVVCYRSWACIKQKIYPPIPEPVLTGKWLSPKGVVPYCPKEELPVAVPKLHSLPRMSNDGYICQRDQLITSTKIPELDLPLKKNILQTSSLTSTRLNIPSVWVGNSGEYYPV